MKPPKGIVKKYAAEGSVNDLNDTQKQQYYALPEDQREQFLKDTLASMGKTYTPTSNPTATATPAQMVSNPASTTGTTDMTTKAVNVATQTATNIAQRNAAQKAAEVAAKKGAETAATSAAGKAASTAGSVASAVPWAAVGEVGGDIVRSTGTQTGSDTSVYATNMGADALTRAGQGAALGTVIAPGVGTAVGAIVGGAAGLVEGAFKANKQTKINAQNRSAEQYNQTLKAAGKGVYAKGGKVNTSQYDSYVDYLNSQYATNSSYSTGAAGEQNKQEMLSERFGDQRFNPPTKLKAGGKLPTPMTRSGMNPDFTAIPGYGEGGETKKTEKKIKKPAKTIDQTLIGMGIGAPLGLMGGAIIGSSYGEENAPYGDIPSRYRTTPQVDERAAFITKNNLLGMGIGTLSSGLLGAGVGAVKGAIENARYQAQQDRYHKAAKIARDLKAAEQERMLLKQSVEKVRQNQLKMNPDVNPENLPIDEEAKQKYLEELNLRRGGEGNKSKQMYREQMIDSGAFFGAADGGTINAKYTKKPKGTMPYPTMAKGGEISGPGGPKDDAISATVEEGSFIVPAENASIAEYIRAKYLNKPTEKANLAQGGKSTSDVMLSDGEHMFTKAEVDKLTKMGIDLNELAPNSNPENKLQYGGAIALKEGGINIKPSKKGTFTAAATKHGKGVQEFASQVMANKENYSPAMVKKANFAKNAAKWKHAMGGEVRMAKGGLLGMSYAKGGVTDNDPKILFQKAGATVDSNQVNNVMQYALKMMDLNGIKYDSDKSKLMENPKFKEIVDTLNKTNAIQYVANGDYESANKQLKGKIKYITPTEKDIVSNKIVDNVKSDANVNAKDLKKSIKFTPGTSESSDINILEMMSDKEQGEGYIKSYIKSVKDNTVVAKKYAEGKMTTAEFLKKNGWTDYLFKTTNPIQQKTAADNIANELISGNRLSDAEAQLQDYKKLTQSKDFSAELIDEATYTPTIDLPAKITGNIIRNSGTNLNIGSEKVPSSELPYDQQVEAARYRVNNAIKNGYDLSTVAAADRELLIANAIKNNYDPSQLTDADRAMFNLGDENENQITNYSKAKDRLRQNELAGNLTKMELIPRLEPKLTPTSELPEKNIIEFKQPIAEEQKKESPKWYQNENLKDLGLLASLGQIGTGLYSTMTSKRPIDQITPEYADAIANAQVSAKTGYTPAERAKLETDIEMTRRSGADMSGQMAGGNTATAMANIRAGNIDAANSLIKVAGEDAAIKRQNQEFATGLLGKLDARKRQIFDDSLEAFKQTQEAGSNLLGAGIDNLVKRQRSKQWEKFLKEDLKKAGNININIGE